MDLMANREIVSGDDYLNVLSLEAISIKELVRHLESNPQIKKFFIRCNNIKGEECRLLSLIKSLDSISVEITVVDNNSVEPVSEMSILTFLSVQRHRLTSEEAKKSSKCKNLVEIVLHESTMEQIYQHYIKSVYSVYVESPAKLTYLTKIRLRKCFINDEFVKLLADTNCFHNLTRLYLSDNRIGNQAVCALAKSLSFPNLKYLYLKKTNIGWEGANELALSCTLKSLTVVNLSGSDLHDVGGVKKLSQITYSRKKPIFILSEHLDVFHKLLKKVLSNKMTIDEILVGDTLCSFTKWEPGSSILKYLLKQKEKYPLRLNLNLKGSHNHCIFQNFLVQPGAEKVLFELGAIPAAISEVSETISLKVDTVVSQPVYMSPMVKKINFITKYLVDSVNANERQVEQAVQSLKENILSFLRKYQSDPILLKLLNLSDSEKIRVLEFTHYGSSLPSDEEFVESVIHTVKMDLDQIEDYSDTRFQHDYTMDSPTVTIPQFIGYIKLLIDSFSVPLDEKIQLLVTVMEQNPNLVEQKLGKSNFDRPQLYEWVKTMTDENIGQLFLCVSGLDIEETWREQKIFVLLKHIYISVTADGDYASMWTQIVASFGEIDSKLLSLYQQQLDRDREIERLLPYINRDNSYELANFLAGKLIEYAAFKPRVRKSLEEFVFGMIDLKKSEKITFEQQQILAQLNSEFTLNVKKFLPNYEREVPTQKEYDVIIENVLKSETSQDFAKGARSTSTVDFRLTGLSWAGVKPVYSGAKEMKTWPKLRSIFF